MPSDKTTFIFGKTLDQWEDELQAMPGGFAADQPTLTGLLGVYYAILDGEVKCIGRSVEPRGLKKRLADFRRTGNSGRDYPAGRLIYQHVDRLELRVIVTGIDNDAAVAAAELKEALSARHSPPWNFLKPETPEPKVPPVPISARHIKAPQRRASTED